MDHGVMKFGWKSAEAELAHAYLLPAILDFLPKKQGLRILDAGCGNGFIAGKLAELGHNVVAFDLSYDGIAIARRTYPHIQFEVLSVYDDLFVIAKEMDLVISSEVIEHLFYPQRYLRNLYSVIQPSGWIILTTPYHGYLKNLTLSVLNLWDKHHTVDWEGGHIKFFSQKTLTKMLLDTGFANLTFSNAGRGRWFWKSMVCRARKNA